MIEIIETNIAIACIFALVLFIWIKVKQWRELRRLKQLPRKYSLGEAMVKCANQKRKAG